MNAKGSHHVEGVDRNDRGSILTSSSAALGVLLAHQGQKWCHDAVWPLGPYSNGGDGHALKINP